MSPLRLQYARLFELLAELAERRLSSEGANELRELLIADPVARGIYRQYQSVIAGLSWECTDPAEHAGHNFAEASDKEAETTQRIDDAATTKFPFGGITRPIIQPIIGLHRGTASTLSRPVFWSICIVGAMFCLYAGTLLWNLRNADLPSGTDRSDLAVATIRETSEVEWSEDSQSPLAPDKAPKGYPGAGGEGSAIAQNQQLQITSGLIELELKQGTTLLIEGPADWKITGENSATLTHGKLVARVPQQAIGFTLETPTAKITDLGTEFGVEVTKDGTANVHVSKGKIDVQSASGSSKPGPGELKAGQSARITSAGATVETNASVPDKFKRLVEAGNKEPAALATNPATGLVAYYPFDGDLQDHAAEYAANAGKIEDDLKLIGKGEFLEGQVGRALRLQGGHCAAPFSADIQLPPTFTIEAWIVAERLHGDYQRLVLNWSDIPKPSYAYHLSIRGKGLELGIGQANGDVVRLVGGDLKIERWQHIAGVANGSTLRIYINGEEIAAQPYGGTLHVSADEGLGIGDSVGSPAPHIRFHGAIDELAIWNVALTTEQIAEHARASTKGYRFQTTTESKDTAKTEK